MGFHEQKRDRGFRRSLARRTSTICNHHDRVAQQWMNPPRFERFCDECARLERRTVSPTPQRQRRELAWDEAPHGRWNGASDAR